MRTLPDGLKVRRQIFKFLPAWNDDLRLTLTVLIDLAFDLTDTLQRLIPASLQLVGDESIVRVGRVVLFLRSSGGV